MKSEEEIPEACREARHAIARFVGAALVGALDRRLRAHLDGCEECARSYRETLAGAARMGRAVRATRTEEEARERRAAFRQRALEATEGPRRRNRFGLRLALLPAGIALLLVALRSGRQEQALFVRWDGGAVLVQGRQMTQDERVQRLEDGVWLTTQGPATARVFDRPDPGAEAPRIELGPETIVLVLDVDAIELRLASGSLELDGRSRVSTQHGVLDLDGGRARVALVADGYELICHEGSVSWTGPSGTRELHAGQELRSSVLADALAAHRAP